MSDGPHRSLPMRRAWKEFAKRGDQSTYDFEQVAEAATNALATDFKEVSWSLVKTLKSIFTGQDNSLGLPEIALQQLDDAKRLAGGSVFGSNAVAWGIQLINEGRFGLDAFHDAIGLAAKERGFANIRSVEEHYIRASNQRHAARVSTRMLRAIHGISENRLGLMLAAPQLVGARRSMKRTSLDEGVPL